MDPERIDIHVSPDADDLRWALSEVLRLYAAESGRADLYGKEMSELVTKVLNQPVDDAATEIGALLMVNLRLLRALALIVKEQSEREPDDLVRITDTDDAIRIAELTIERFIAGNTELAEGEGEEEES